MRFFKAIPAARMTRNYCITGLIITMAFAFFLIFCRNIDIPSIRVNLQNYCHYMRDSSDFRDTRKLKFNTKLENLIFFLETSCRSTYGTEDRALKPRQACAVESAALLNPKHNVYVLFASSVPKMKDAALTTLLDYPNIHFSRIYLDSYLSDTPLESWIRSGQLDTSQYPTEHTSDVLRLLTLWKFGGIYLDLDVIVVKPLQTLETNWVGWQKSGTCANGVMSFSRNDRGRKFTDAALREISTNFRGDIWSHNGPDLINRVMKQLCSDHQMPGNTSEARCKGFRILDSDYFYPISYAEWSLYFEPEGMERIKKTENITYLYHVWNKLSSQRKIKANSTVPYTYLARKYCPKVFALTEDYF